MKACAAGRNAGFPTDIAYNHAKFTLANWDQNLLETENIGNTIFHPLIKTFQNSQLKEECN